MNQSEERDSEGQNPFLKGMTRKKRLPWFLLVIVVSLAVVITYLYLVFMAAFQYSKFNVPGRYTAKPGLTIPDDFPKECIPVYVGSSMTPYADKTPPHEMHYFPEYKDRGSVWLLDSAVTRMYEAELLKHPRCLQFRLQEMAAIKNRMILVIYDKATKSDVLVVRNYP